MRISTIPLLIAVSVLPFAALAQTETETPAPAAEAEAEATPSEQAPAPADPLASNEESFPIAEEETGGMFLRETHGSWEVRCLKGDEEKCNLYQLLKGSEGNSVAEINMEALPKGGQAVAGVTMVTPLGTLLPAQATLRIDTGKAKRYPFSWCETAGCVSRFGLTDAEVASLKKGAEGIVSIVSVVAPKTPIELTLSLTGFTAAWDSIAPK